MRASFLRNIALCFGLALGVSGVPCGENTGPSKQLMMRDVICQCLVDRGQDDWEVHYLTELICDQIDGEYRSERCLFFGNTATQKMRIFTTRCNNGSSGERDSMFRAKCF
ncbi:hypothetical protein FRC12_023901 [Ceratobasidium sp. 428]|nr:hypothetical protein FRC12_023901 [Ceratobasidium sp. 428]